MPCLRIVGVAEHLHRSGIEDDRELPHVYVPLARSGLSIESRVLLVRATRQPERAAAALRPIMAALGLYSVIAYSVAQRTQEMGVRLALGARVSDILSLVIRQGILVAASGAAVGAGAALILATRIQPLLFQVPARSAGVYAGVIAAMLLVALGASLIPAWRAARVNPMLVLRSD